MAGQREQNGPTKCRQIGKNLVGIGLRILVFASLVVAYLWLVKNHVGDSVDRDAPIFAVNRFLQDIQHTLLALVVALAAYTGSLEQKLRESMSGKGEVEKKPHLKDLRVLVTADVWLVTTAFLIIMRLGASTLRPSDDSWNVCLAWMGHAILGGIGLTISYFGLLHAWQWLQPRESCGTVRKGELLSLPGAAIILGALTKFAESHNNAVTTADLKKLTALVQAAQTAGIKAEETSEFFATAGDFFPKP